MRSLICFVCLVVVAGGAGIVSVLAEEPKAGPAIYNVFSEEDELLIGRQASSDVEKKTPVLDSEFINDYVNSVGQALAKKSRRSNIPYHFKVLNSPVINAFALPGGYIYFYRGMLHVIENESELAAVLGHEIGHVVGRHGTNNLSRYAIVATFVQQVKKAGVLDEGTINQALNLVGGSIGVFVNAKFSREQETEADLFGVYNVVRAGWDPHGAITTFEKFQKFSGDKDLLQQLLSTHPLPRERIETVSAEIAKMPATSGLSQNSLAFEGMKLRLKMMPPPPPAQKEQL